MNKAGGLIIYGCAMLGLSHAACDDDNNKDDVVVRDGGDGRDAGNERDGSSGDAGEERQVTTDAEIAAVTTAANKGEVEQGNIAIRKAQTPAVRAFARDMVDKHTRVQTRQAELLTAEGIVPKENPVSEKVTADSDAIVDRLNAAPADEFDRVYMESQVDVHEQVLKLLDDQLIPVAKNAALKDELRATRTEVAKHLEEARTILDELDTSGDGGVGDAGTDAGRGADGGR